MPSFGEELKKDEKKEEEEDPRSMGTKYRNMKNRWRAMGLKLSHEPEGELTEAVSYTHLTLPTKA